MSRSTNCSRRQFLQASLLSLPSLGWAGHPYARSSRKNVLFIIWDDQNDMVSLDGDSVVKTPNLARLARRSVSFTHAYCSAPACGPSRTSLLTGTLPSTSGIYYNSQCNRVDRSNPVWELSTLPEHFRKHGYLTGVCGKVFHGRGFDLSDSVCSPGWYRPFKGYWEGVRLEDMAWSADFRQYGGSNFAWGPFPEGPAKGEPHPSPEDVRNADAVIDMLGGKHDKPFFLALGVCRPHLPWIVPQRYFDLYPPNQMEMPRGYRRNDLDDVPKPGRWLATQILKGAHDAIIKAGQWQEALQAYHACTTFADEQLGRVLDALDGSPYAENTIVVFCCDHGYHHGEKEHWTKFTLWEKSNRVPFMVSVPGSASKGKTCTSPVSLLDIYPTLVSLCDLPRPLTHELEGVDVSPLLRDVRAKRGRPVLSTYGYHNHSLRSDRYRYIRYRNGDEELYDHFHDPYEWTNIIGDSQARAVVDGLAQCLPRLNAPESNSGGALGWKDEAFR